MDTDPNNIDTSDSDVSATNETHRSSSSHKEKKKRKSKDGKEKKEKKHKKHKSHSRDRSKDRERERDRSREHSHREHREGRDGRDARDIRDRDRDRDRDPRTAHAPLPPPIDDRLAVDRERDRDRYRDSRDRDRDWDRDRDRERDRERERDRDRDRRPRVEYPGDRDRDRDRDRERDRERERERDRERDGRPRVEYPPSHRSHVPRDDREREPPPPPPPPRDLRDSRDARDRERDRPRDPPSVPVTDITKLPGVQLLPPKPTPQPTHPLPPAPPPQATVSRTETPEPDAAVTPTVQPSAASVMESLSVEDKVRQRKERIEKWRLERLAKEQAENGGLPTASLTNSTDSGESSSMAVDAPGDAAAAGTKRKVWSLEDDSDEDEESKATAAATAAAASAAADSFKLPPLKPLSAKSVDESTFGTFKRPAASAATQPKKSPFSSLKPVVSKLSPFTSSFGVSSKPGVTSSLKVSTPSGNVFDEDDEGSNETVGLDARGRKLKGVVALKEEETSTTTDMDVDKKEETDELEAFMVDVNSEVKKLAEEDLKTLKSVNAAAVVAGAAAAAAMETESAVGDAKKTGGGDEDGEGEAGDDDDDDIMGAAAKLFAGKRKELSQIDHSLQNYAPFRKDFYVEPREIAEMTPAEVEIKRAELGGIIIRGVKCPKPIEKWTQMGLPTSVADVIKKGLKYEKPSGIQAQSIPAVMSGRDVIGIAKTGSGKTIAFLLPMFRHIKDQDPLKTGDGPIALIMTPTRELATQIHRECKHFTKALNLRAVCCYGGAPIKDQIAELKRGAEIIICTPGRMIDLLCANSGRVTNLKRVTYLVLDEADRMFDMGFEPQVMKIVNNIRPSRQTILFSATFPRKMEALARKILVKPLEITVGGRSTVCSDVHQIVEVRDEDSKFYRVLEILGDCFANDPDAKVLIFVDRHEAADNLLRDLLKRGYPCQSLHGGKDQADRQSTFQDFKTGDTNIVIATSVAARGLDVKQLKIVINYECPNHMEDYVHRCGRTGRAGKKGTAYTFITPDQDKYAVDIVQALKMSNVPVPEDVQALADSFITKVKAGTANYTSSGFGGKGLDKLDKERDAVKQYQKKSHGGGFEDEEEEEEEVGERPRGGDESDAFTDEEEDNDVFSFKTTTVRAPGAAPGASAAAAKPDKEREEAIAQAAAAAASARVAALEASGGAIEDIEKAKKAAAEATARLGQDGLNKAKDIIALLNKKLIPGNSADPAAKRNAGEAPFAVEIEINDYPQKARWKVTNKEMINQITDISGSAITTRGLFFEKGKPVPPGQRKLYLFIEADTQIQIDRAKKEIKRILREATLMAMEEEASRGGGGRYLITG